MKTLPFDGTTDGTDLSDQQDEIGPEIRLSFRATFAPLKSALSGKSVVYSVFVFSLSYYVLHLGLLMLLLWAVLSDDRYSQAGAVTLVALRRRQIGIGENGVL